MKQNRITHIQLCAFFISIMLMTCVSVWGESSMEQAFAEMPDSIIPYLTKNNRLDCIDFMKNNMKAEVENKFGGKSVLTAMTDNYLKLHLNEITDVEMKIFKVEGKDSILCMAKTIKTPEPDTEIIFYDLNWKPIEDVTPFGSIGSRFLDEPSGKADYKVQGSNGSNEPTMYEVTLSKDDETITIKSHRFYTNDKDLKDAAETTIKYKWNGKTMEQELH
ncbi:MAG: DUF3256 family protein [Prevotellaceae bacterium]|nr:DUF3256 family protein [Prevotellaceae bacterium]